MRRHHEHRAGWQLDHRSPPCGADAGVRAPRGRASRGRCCSHSRLRPRFKAALARGESMKRLSPVVVALVAAACSHGPPPDFAPDPGLVAQIRELRMATSTRACPGETFGATYTAVLTDGGLVTFESRYDRKHPPRLHVRFLERTSDQATPLEGGAWVADPDALTSAVSGFRVTAALKAKPSVNATAVLTPDYACLPHSYGFRGAGAGAAGPQVTVRVGILRSPFYERLLAVGVEVEDAPPFYVFADANAVPPSDWVIIEARGARGARGTDG